MDAYELELRQEVTAWKKKLTRKSGAFERISKNVQSKVNTYIPTKIHQIMTDSIRTFIQSVLTGSAFVSKKRMVSMLTWHQKEEWIRETITTYRKTAVIEGAGTGAGGVLLGVVDFPLLLSIKMKLLFEISGLYGYDAKNYEERLFILHIFQLAFSGEKKRRETLLIIESWENHIDSHDELNWQEFQQEYRDYIDFVKLFQLVPGIGAVVGAYANYNLLEHLGETAMNCYRLRNFSDMKE